MGSVTDLRTERPSELREPGPVPGVPDRDEHPPALPAPAPVDGVPLTRLLALVRLTAPQALELGADLLAAAAGRADPPDPDAAGPHRALVGTDGRVVLAPGGHGGGSPMDAAALAALLADVADAARLRNRPPEPAAVRLLAPLDRAAAELPDAGLPAVAERLREAAAGIDRDAARAELAALARAVAGRTAPGQGGGPAAGPPAAAPARRATRKERRTALRRVGAWVLSVLVLAAVVAGEIALFRDEIAADVDLLLDAGRSGDEPSGAEEPDGVPIPPPAPAAAGDVTAVDLRPLAECAPAGPCTVRLLVRVVPAPDPRPVTWSYRLVDRCTGAATTVPGGTLTVPGGSRAVAAVGVVALPDLPAVAVLAVTEQPAVAASAPVPTGSCLPDRPAE